MARRIKCEGPGGGHLDRQVRDGLSNEQTLEPVQASGETVQEKEQQIWRPQMGKGFA